MANKKTGYFSVTFEFSSARQMSKFLSGQLPFEVSIEDHNSKPTRRRRRIPSNEKGIAKHPAPLGRPRLSA